MNLGRVLMFVESEGEMGSDDVSRSCLISTTYVVTTGPIGFVL